MKRARRARPAPAPLIFFRLVMASSVTVAEAAQMVGRIDRTVRLWCEAVPMGCRVGGGPLRISLPLLEAYAAGYGRDVALFLAGAPPSPIIMGAFQDHGADEALATFHTARLLAEGKSGNPGSRVRSRQA